MFKEDLRQRYADDKRFAKSGSRPPIDCFVDRENRERRFMPRRNSIVDLSRWASFVRGVRQVVRDYDGRIRPRFSA